MSLSLKKYQTENVDLNINSNIEPKFQYHILAAEEKQNIIKGSNLQIQLLYYQFLYQKQISTSADYCAIHEPYISNNYFVFCFSYLKRHLLTHTPCCAKIVSQLALNNFSIYFSCSISSGNTKAMKIYMV